jgi:aspartate/methionine/tyrosine aminotransferase
MDPILTGLAERRPNATPRPHLYSDPGGIAALRDRLVDKVRSRNRIPVAGRENVLITAGATAGLAAAAAAIVAPGDEVLVLAPYPLIRGTIEARGRPVEVPVLTDPAHATSSASTGGWLRRAHGR